MTASQIRQRFLDYFAKNGHAIRPSASLVPGNDPTLLFTNAGMVQFKGVFLGEEKQPFNRATTSQKCLRVSGKHNDLEEVGVTIRHHTFFEMLGNFSFGDYFKRDAIKFAWELLTEEYGMPKDRLWATVHHSDDEAAKLWEEITGLPPSRIVRLGDKDNFWQMADTGPCGPCSEIHFDRREDPSKDLSTEEFVALTDSSDILEFWNLVFMQYDRSADGTLTPLPAPSIDTGMGLDRLAMLLQGVQSNYHNDLFMPLIERAVEVVGVPYKFNTPEGISYHVLADHARAVAFLLSDGVFPSNEGRGYVLRRVLRRAVRHAWLLGRREPTLTHVVDKVVDVMSDAYPDLKDRREHLVRSTREEEERFLATVEQGMERLDELMKGGNKVIPGADVFKLYDTFGFPVDLTELIAKEHGFEIDNAGFEAALGEQRARSRADRKASAVSIESQGGWEEISSETSAFVGYDKREVETSIVGYNTTGEKLMLDLHQRPFYLESGGQISDIGVVAGQGWSMQVEDVRMIGGRAAVIGTVDGKFNPKDKVVARVAGESRHDTERNHTATHLLHAALRNVLGKHVLQQGSLVAPDRLRFDFSHPKPMTPEEIRAVEDQVNRAILEDHPVTTAQTTYPEAVAKGAMALFGEKYGDVVRMVQIPDVSIELCGGTHVRHTGEIGLFRIVQETGVASGVRRVEAITGTVAYKRVLEREEQLNARIEQLSEEVRDLQKTVKKIRQSGSSDQVGALLEKKRQINGFSVIAETVDVETSDDLRALADRVREGMGSGAAILASPSLGTLVAFSTDDAIGKGIRAEKLIKGVTQITGGSGGGRPNFAQGKLGDPAKVAEAFAQLETIVAA
ncbi:MAG TPA: alanine--tRNA ligase [Longimicrobiales bacterium]|nr:alanine--tRNA ligase [Longimicrobiales bacterium]